MKNNFRLRVGQDVIFNCQVIIVDIQIQYI